MVDATQKRWFTVTSEPGVDPALLAALNDPKTANSFAEELARRQAQQLNGNSPDPPEKYYWIVRLQSGKLALWATAIFCGLIFGLIRVVYYTLRWVHAGFAQEKRRGN
jgi:hypothetical protein